MFDSLTVEYSITASGPLGTEYTVYFPDNTEQVFSISAQDCAILRRNELDALEHFIKEALLDNNLEITLVRR